MDDDGFERRGIEARAELTRLRQRVQALNDTSVVLRQAAELSRCRAHELLAQAAASALRRAQLRTGAPERE